MERGEVKIVVVNGYPGVGKTSFIMACMEFARVQGWASVNHSSVDPAKRAARILGWHGQKDAGSRNVLAILKALSIEHYDGPLEYLSSMVLAAAPKTVIFVDIREPDEIAKFVRTWPTTKTVLVRGPKDSENLPGNPSDGGVLDYSYDYTVYNLTTLDALGQIAASYMEALLK